MKGGMSSLFYVLERLKQEGRRPKGDIIVQSVVGEEVGEAGTKRACEIGPEATWHWFWIQVKIKRRPRWRDYWLDYSEK